jgi:DNA-binding MarR family transcriptional regulator
MPFEDSNDELFLRAGTLRRSTAALARRLRALRAGHGLPASKLSILGWLARAQQPLTASRLAELERLQPQSLTRSIAELDAAGLIRRREDEADRRSLLIEITGKGTDLVTEDARRQNQWLAQAMQKLTRAELDMLAIAAQLIDRLVEEDIPPAGGDPAADLAPSSRAQE